MNVVSTACLNSKFDLLRLAIDGDNTEYNSRRFKGVFINDRKTMTTATVFSNGKMVCTGATSKEASSIAAKRHAKKLRKLGYKGANLTDFKVRDIAATYNVDHKIKLTALHDFILEKKRQG